MTNEYALSAARMMVKKSHAEIGLIADRLFNERTMGQDVRHQLGRRLNAANVSLNTALMLLDDADVKLSVWGVVYMNYEPPEVNSLWLDETEAKKEADRKNAEYGRVAWRAEKMAVQREWRTVADAEEASV